MEENENKKELDLSGVRLVQKKRRQEQGLDLTLALIAHKDGTPFDIAGTSLANELNDINYQNKVINYSEKIARKSIQDDSFSKVQVCHGEHYTKKEKQKENLKKIFKIALILASIYIGGKVIDASMVISEYNASLKEKIKKEYLLTDEELKQVELPGIFESLNQYEAEYKKLDKNDYNINGTRKKSDGIRRSYADEIDIFSINDRQIDAIENATDKHLKDIKGIKQ